MASINVTPTYNSEFGSRGAGNNQFDYPSGCIIASSQLYICDKQNNRIQIFDLAGNYISKFGSYGSGNDNFSFPEGIETDGTYIYVVDSANHRIKKHDLAGLFISEFGSRGAGNAEFDYPCGITLYDEKLYIADKQNGRIKVHLKDGTYVSEISGLNFPEGVTTLNDLIIISDSGNKKVKYYTPALSFLFNANTIFNYPTSVKNINGVICVCERQASYLTFLDDLGNKLSDFGEVGSTQNKFNFPYDSVFTLNPAPEEPGLMFIVDSANHRIEIFSIEIKTDVPTYSDELLEQTKQLYPTGRAWWMKKGSIFELFHLGLAFSESRVVSFVRGLLDSIIPDNDNFSEVDATRWESALGLFIQPNTPLENRKEGIIRKMQYPGSVPARQHFKFVEVQLRLAGFDVYVHENRFGDPPTVAPTQSAIYGNFFYGQLPYGSSAVTGTPIANFIDESRDESFNFGDSVNARATFFIGAATYPNRAIVLTSRKQEFRELILKLKPAQTAGLLLIDYVDSMQGIGFDVIGLDMEVY